MDAAGEGVDESGRDDTGVMKSPPLFDAPVAVLVDVDAVAGDSMISIGMRLRCGFGLPDIAGAALTSTGCFCEGVSQHLCA